MGGFGYFGEVSPPALLPPFHGEGGDSTCHILVNTMKFFLSILMENWGDPEGFKAAAVEPLSRALGGTGASTGTDPKNLEGLAEQVYLVTSQIRNLQIRHIDNHPDLIKAQKALEPAFAANPARQGSLWLAVRMRQEALSLLDTPEGETTYGRIVNGLDEQRALVNKRFKETDQLTLDALETGFLSPCANCHRAAASHIFDKALLQTGHSGGLLSDYK